MRRVLSIARCAAKRIAKGALAAVVLIAVATTIVVCRSGDENFQPPQLPAPIVNDITQLNPVQVARVVTPTTIEEIVETIKTTMGPISVGGGHFSQGGQTAFPDSVHFDMRGFNKVLEIDAASHRVTVQSGITWRQLQEKIDPFDLSVSIMQTYANFTVGGSLSVNVHGRYIGEGPLVHSVQSFKIVLADGTIVTASPTENPDIFNGAIGGYGGLGIIVEATLRLADNVRIARTVERMPLSVYGNFFRKNIRDDKSVIFHNADIYPPNYDTVSAVTWNTSTAQLTTDQRLIPVDEKYVWGPRLAEFVADYDVGKWMRQHVFEPLYYTQPRVVPRNWEASYDVRELEPQSREEFTYVLREYFVPVRNLDQFVPKMAEIFRRHKVNIINVSIRHAKADPGTLMAWAREEVFAYVVYYRQGTSRAAQEAVKAWTIEMVDAAVAAGGTYYLPYQNYPTRTQFLAAYPRAYEFFALKERLDPKGRFTNELWDKYRPTTSALIDDARAKVADYFRGEEQTILTVPEWYLVFNPAEYADYLAAGKNPSDFPFFASIEEYWSLYDRVLKIARQRQYPKNDQYKTMLQVIGVSTTAEYLVKGAYETTVGRFFRATASHETEEEKFIAKAQRAYSDLIYVKPWYVFPFSAWTKRMWTEVDIFGADFPRKFERRLFFTAEFSTKALYAAIIKYAAESNYGVSEDTIYLTAHAKAMTPTLPEGAKALAVEGNTYLMAVPRWGGFTAIIPKLVAAGFDLDDVSGNRLMAISLIAEKSVAIPNTTVLFESRVLSAPEGKRSVILAHVSDLNAVIEAAAASGARVEHFYDY